ncbi:MAG: ComEC/Rec2 family competence protein [Prevotella sp.]|nr:ComEC/Rec2 family competence protein [Prevotella sp.]
MNNKKGIVSHRWHDTFSFSMSPLLRLVPWLVAGIIVQPLLPFCWHPWPFVACVVVAFAARRHPLLQSVCIGLSTLLLGTLLTSMQRQRLTFPTNDRWQTVEAVVASEPVEKPRSVAVDLLLTANGRRVKAYLAKDNRSLRIVPGDGLMLTTRIEPTYDIHYNGFDYGHYLLVNGFTSRCFVRKDDWKKAAVSIATLSIVDRIKLKTLRWRHHLLQRFKSLAAADSDSYGVMAAMTLGDRSAISNDLRASYSLTGASHVLALSGLHMSILYCLISMLTFVGRRMLIIRALTIVLFWSFAMLTGLSPSVVRSALMLTLAAIITLRGTRSLSVNSLSLAAIVMLIASPLTLYDVGFQLSFLAVFAIVMLMPLMERILPPFFLLRHPFLRIVWSIVAVSIAAQMGTAPLVAYYFGRLPLYFIITNFLVIPAAYAILWLSLTYLILPFTVVGQSLLFVVSKLNAGLKAMSAWPYASIGPLQLSPVQVVAIYVVEVCLVLTICILAANRLRSYKAC